MQRQRRDKRQTDWREEDTAAAEPVGKEENASANERLEQCEQRVPQCRCLVGIFFGRR